MPFEDVLRQAAERYEGLRPAAREACGRLSEQLAQTLDRAGIPLAMPVTARVKEWHSVRDKLARSPSDFVPLERMQDLIGLRVLVLFQRDLTPSCQAIVERFEVVKHDDTAVRLGDDRFGYASHHIVIAVPQAEGLFPPAHALQAEIQIRTVAQHIWAAASHMLQYKREASVPPPVRRAVYRVAALLETVDLELERVLAQRDQYNAEHSSLSSDEELNVDSLASALHALWPPVHHHRHEPYEALLRDLQRRGITTPRQLHATVRAHRSAALAHAAQEADRLAFLADRHPVTGGKISYQDGPNRHATVTVTDDVLARARDGVFFSHTGLTWTALRMEGGRS